jgi:hypothetical protein
MQAPVQDLLPQRRLKYPHPAQMLPDEVRRDVALGSLPLDPLSFLALGQVAAPPHGHGILREHKPDYVQS